MRIFVTGFLAAYLVLLFPDFVGGEPQIEVDLKPSKIIQAGKNCHFLVRLSWRSTEGDYRFLQPELALKNLAVESVGEANETFQKEGEEWKKKSFRFDLRALRAGKAKIQPFRIDYLDPSHETGGHFEVGPLELNVFPAFTKFRQVGFIASGLLLIVGSGLGGWILIRQRRKKQETTQSSESLLEDRALSRLNENREKVSEEGKIFRVYLCEKYSLARGVGTGREILHKMEGKVPWDELKTLKRIFDTLEERQYNDSRQSSEEGERLYSEMVHYVKGKKII